MTEPSSVQEPDLVPGWRLLRIFAVAVCVATLGVLVSWWMLRGARANEAPPRAAAAAAFGAEAPEQTSLETSERGLALQREQRKQLSRYGWRDRDAGIAEIPIDRAIDLRAEDVP